MIFPPAKVSVEVYPDPSDPSRMTRGVRLIAPLCVPLVIDRYPKSLEMKVTVPEGYFSDGASVPRIFWRLLSPPIDPVTLTPSIVHDWLYDFGSKLGLTRSETDEWYANALCANGYPTWKSMLTFVGVRLGGSKRWID